MFIFEVTFYTTINNTHSVKYTQHTTDYMLCVTAVSCLSRPLTLSLQATRKENMSALTTRQEDMSDLITRQEDMFDLITRQETVVPVTHWSDLAPEAVNSRESGQTPRTGHCVEPSGSMLTHQNQEPTRAEC